MIIKILFILLLFTFCNNSIGQNKIISGIVFNKNDGNAIPYAIIHSTKSNIFYNTDENGKFKIDIPINDTIIFSCIGYENLTLVNFSLIDTIYLNEKINQLEDVIVSKSLPLEIGILENKKTRSFLGELLNDSYEAVNLIKVPEKIKQYKITKIKFKQKTYSPNMIFRLHIYTVDDNNLPGEELLKKQIIMSKEYFNNGILEFDLKDQNIILEKSSFFAGIQFISSDKVDLTKMNNDIGIGETNRLKEILTYRRNRGLNYKWHVEYEKGVLFPGIKGKNEDIIPIPLKGAPINLLASAIIEIL
jgi:CarboxypepD_reg-like domain